MKKNNRVLRIGLLALVLTLVTASLVSGTFAKYVTIVNGTGTVSVADWIVSLNTANGSKTDVYEDTVAFQLFDNNGDAGILSSNLIAPGSGNSYGFNYNTAGTQVDHKVSLVLKATNNLESIDNLTLYLGNTKLTTEQLSALTSSAGLQLASQDVIQAGAGAEKAFTFSWEWPFQNATTASASDQADTLDGIGALKDVSFSLAFKAEQVNP